MVYKEREQKLYTNDGVYIKDIHCPFKEKEIQRNTHDTQLLECSVCQKSILDTDGKTDEEVLTWVKQNGNASCLAFSLNDLNIKVNRD